MGPLVALLLMLSAAVLWLFFKFQPETPLASVRKLVNRLFLGLAGVLAAVSAGRIYTIYEGPLALQMALVYAFGMIFVVIGLGFLLRNFVIFRRQRY